MARTLNTTVMVDGVIYDAGTPESDIKGEITAQGVWDGEADAKEETGGAGYSDQGVDDLTKLAAERKLEVEGTGKDGNVLKDDLVKALEADDVANA